MKQKVFCVIMGGGRGTRLRPLTTQRCKPAVPLAGKYRLADIPISNCLNSGLNQIFVLTQFNTASLHRHIQESYKFDPFGGGYVEILSAEQTDLGDNWYQGTADAVRQNLHHFGAGDDDLYLILSGDQLYRMDFQTIIQAHRDAGAAVTISATPVERSLVSAFGLMRINDTLEIEEFVEKPTEPSVIESLLIPEHLKARMENPGDKDYCLASMGIYVFNARCLHDALQGNEADFGKEIIPGLLGKAKLQSFMFDGYWEDIGTVGAFFEANLRLADDHPPFNFFDGDKPIYTHARYLPASKLFKATLDHAIVSDGCIIHGARIKRSVIGVRSVVHDGAELDNCVVMGNDEMENEESIAACKAAGIPRPGIGRGSRIRNAIIDKNARIGEDVVLTPEGKPDMWHEGDLFVRDGVLIVNKNGIVPPGTRIEP